MDDTGCYWLFDASDVGMLHVNAHDRRVLRANAAFCDMTGFGPNELCALMAHQLVYPDDIERDRTHHERLLATGQGYEIEKRYVRKTGEIVWVCETVNLVCDAQGHAASVFVVVRDITANKYAAPSNRSQNADAQQQALVAMVRELRESEQRFRVALAHTPILVYETDAQLRYRWMYNNPDRFGQYEIIGKRDDEVLPYEQVADLMRFKAEVLNTGGRARREIRLAFEGRVEYWDVHAEAVRDAQGHVTGLIVSALDITERKRIEDELRASEERMQMSMTIADAATWDYDMITGVLHWSASHFRLLGFEPTPDGRAEMRMWQDAIPPDDLERMLGEWQRAEKERDLFRSEHHIRRADGELIWARAAGRFFYDDAGRAVRFVGVFFDITDRKHTEEMFREADRRKDEFLAMLAHELRNPLAPVRNGLHILRLKNADDAIRKNVVGMMERQVAQMVRLVDDLLEVSRITRGKIELRRERVDLVSIVHSAIETASPSIEASKHHLTIDLPAEPVVLDADPVRLAQVIANLLNNAAKYTEEGGRIEVRARREGPLVAVSIRDTGMGIPPEMLHRVFDLFTQIDRTLGRAQGGLGIGLALVKRLVDMHGGTVDVHSEGRGMGCEFTVRLPVVNDASAAHATSMREIIQAPVTTSLRMLVVDDNHDAADSLAISLRMGGNETRTAYDGDGACDVAAEFLPDVVLLDIGLPGISGHEA
ncbi:MAG TPA: PAS domain S-box protein, partial [Burkholderiaceae bacterium]|nr:PAS domain S-box protein [Burkholderiaceae bacterium]